MLIVTGDMNAKVGEENWDYDKEMRKHGLWQRNDNGERLCEFCRMNELVTTGTLFPHKNIQGNMHFYLQIRCNNNNNKLIYISL